MKLIKLPVENDNTNAKLSNFIFDCFIVRIFDLYFMTYNDLESFFYLG